MTAQQLHGFGDELVKISKPRGLGDRAGDTATVDDTGRPGVTCGGPAASGRPPPPEQAVRLYGNVIAENLAPVSNDMRTL